MKKSISVLLIMSLVLSMSTFAFATNDRGVKCNGFDFDTPARLQQVEFDPNLVAARELTEEYLIGIWASFKYDEALPEDVRNNILNARVILAYQETWTAGGLFAIDKNTGVVFPYWTSVFPYWDYQQIQHHRISIEQTSVEENVVAPMGGGWSNVNVPRGIFSTVGVFRSIGRDITFENTALDIPHFNFVIRRNGETALSQTNAPRFSTAWFPNWGALVSGDLRVSTSHTVSGIGSFRIM